MAVEVWVGVAIWYRLGCSIKNPKMTHRGEVMVPLVVEF